MPHTTPQGTRLVSPVVTHGQLCPVGLKVRGPLPPSDPAQVGPWALPLHPPQDHNTGSCEGSHQIPRPPWHRSMGEQGSLETLPSPCTRCKSECYPLCVMFWVRFPRCQGCPGHATQGGRCLPWGAGGTWRRWAHCASAGRGKRIPPSHPARGSRKASGCGNSAQRDLRKQNEFFRLEINRKRKRGLCRQW